MKSNYIWIYSYCDNYYKLINKIKNISISIYDSKYIDEIIYLKINKSDYSKIIKNLPGYSFNKYSEIGINKIINNLKKNYLYLISTIISTIVFFICNNVIISVDVIHENKDIKYLVYNSLKEYGVSELTFKKNYQKLDEIRKRVLDKYPDRLDWIEIENHGMKYVIKVEERIINNITESESYCDIFAKKSGVIKSINLKRGVAMVQVGDYVNEGDLLITGSIEYNNEIKNEVCALGDVYAEKWYQVTINTPLEYKDNKESGKKKINFVFENDNVKKRLLKNKWNSFRSELINIFSLFKQNLYLEKQYELKETIVKITEDEAVNKALEIAGDKIKLKLNNKEEIIDKKVLKKTINDSTIEVVVFIVTIELIN